jgi:hypothetical protein
MTIGSGIRVILRVLPQQFERLYHWYYYAAEMTSDGIIQGGSNMTRTDLY